MEIERTIQSTTCTSIYTVSCAPHPNISAIILFVVVLVIRTDKIYRWCRLLAVLCSIFGYPHSGHYYHHLPFMLP